MRVRWLNATFSPYLISFRGLFLNLARCLLLSGLLSAGFLFYRWLRRQKRLQYGVNLREINSFFVLTAMNRWGISGWSTSSSGHGTLIVSNSTRLAHLKVGVQVDWIWLNFQVLRGGGVGPLVDAPQSATVLLGDELMLSSLRYSSREIADLWLVILLVEDKLQIPLCGGGFFLVRVKI